MKLFYKLAIAILALPTLVNAQSNYKPGYAVTLKGDTLKGFIDYREWDTNPASISFRPAGSTKTEKLTINDTRSFTVTGLESYQRYTGSISRDEVKESRISNGRDTSFITATVFLRVLQQGKNVNLYSYTDAIKPRFYYSEPGNEPQELIFRTYGTGTNNRTVNENGYIKQLSAVALKNNILDDKLQQQFDFSIYSQPSLLKLITAINGNAKREKGGEDQVKNKSFDFYTGLAINVTRFTPDGNYKINGGLSATSILPKVSLGFNAYANPNTQRLVFRGEVSIALNKYKARFDNLVTPKIPTEYSFMQTAFTFNPHVILHLYNADDFKFFVGGGIEFQFYTYSGKKYEGQDGTKINTALEPFYLAKVSNPVVVKAGVLINKRIQIYADYLTLNNVTMDPYFQLTSQSVRVGVNYKL